MQRSDVGLAHKPLSDSPENNFGTFGGRLRALREAFSYSQSQLGELVGCSRVAVSQWESGHTVPTWDKLDFLVEHFTVPHLWLMHGKGSPPAIVRKDKE